MTYRPKLKLFEDSLIKEILEQAFDILETLGIIIENNEALNLFKNIGINSHDNGRITIPRDIVKRAIKTAPKSFTLYDRDGNETVKMKGDNVCFDPGSAAINFLDYKLKEFRAPITKDYLNLSKIVDQLEHVGAQSTSFIPTDVPTEISDSYRLYLSLINCSKPIVTGTFKKESFTVMKDLLIAVRGNEKSLREKPLAIFDNCPSPPLRWSDLTCQSVIDASKLGIPSEMVSMPMMGVNSPASIFGAVVQHTAETLSGIVISQLSSKGAPIVWGGSPSVFDMRKGTTPMGAIETMMIDSGYTQVAKSLGFPTHAYMGLTDVKTLDTQSGLESAFGAAIAALSGVNMVSGLGMIDFESGFSLEKLVIDNDIAGMALRLIEGITNYDGLITKEVLRDYEAKKQLLTHQTTRNLYKKEFFFPSDTIDRSTRDEWAQTKLNSEQRAHKIVMRLLENPDKNPIDEEIKTQLHAIMTKESARYGMIKLPSNFGN